MQNEECKMQNGKWKMTAKSRVVAAHNFCGFHFALTIFQSIVSHKTKTAKKQGSSGLPNPPANGRPPDVNSGGR